MNIIKPYREFSEIVIPNFKKFGKFNLKKFNKFGKLIAEIDFFDNLITDLGLNQVSGGEPQWWTYCMVGTGTAAPNFGNTTLGFQVASTSSRTQVLQNASSIANPATTTISYTFALGAINTNITEVGVGATTTATASRALIVDNLGNPVSFPVASDEQLQVTYIRGHFGPSSDINTTQTLTGVTYNITIACRSVIAAFQPMGITSGFSSAARLTTSTVIPTYGNQASGTTVNSTSRDNYAYVSGSFQRDFFAQWTPGTATGTWNQAEFSLDGFQLNVLYSEGFTKTASMNLILPFRIAWGRV